MKISKMFLGITLIFSIMVMLIGCDVFDPAAKGALGKDLSTVGKLVDAFNDDVREADEAKGIPDPPDPNAELSFNPVGTPPTSRFVFFDKENFKVKQDYIYIVIPKIMAPPIDILYLMGDTDPITEIRDRVYPNASIGSTAGMSSLKTLVMEKSDKNPTNGAAGECFFIKIPGDLSTFTRKDWVAYNGLRMEFVDRSKPNNWDNCRLSFQSDLDTKCSAAMPYQQEYHNDPYTPSKDDYGQYYQVKLSFDNVVGWFVIPDNGLQ